MSSKADFSNVNVNPSLTPWRGANARNVSCSIFTVAYLRYQHSPPTQHHSFYRNLPPLFNLRKVAFGAVLFLKVFFNFSFRFVFIFVRNLFILVNLTFILHVFSLNLLLCVSCENKNSE